MASHRLPGIFIVGLALFSSFTTVQGILPPVQQNPSLSPPLPIIEISNAYISNASDVKAASDFSIQADPPPGAELCSATNPCADGSCCSKRGICGFGPDYCGQDVCVGGCNATAMCGRYSKGGAVKCGLNLCCSYYGWCGTDENHCGNPDPHGQTPCQKDFGSCSIASPPSCGSGSGKTNGRRIGYYQASNVEDRLCNQISPSQIVSDGFTHLYYAFARFDPTSFTMVEQNPDVYTEFTSLKRDGLLQTWVAVGGFDFSDPNTATFHAWSNMAASKPTRSAFIASLKAFMTKYGFQGVDLDWEYPTFPERGGADADTANFVSLVQEMRAEFGTQFGISLTLAPDYWYLRGFDPRAMESSVDWFGFMAYDLHGSWDADVKTLGSKVRAQTDVREIDTDALPLWFDNLDPSKINMGLAYYGRGYTLADPTCNYLGCTFTGPSKAAPCTNYDGVMSLQEIEDLIAEKNLTPTLVQDAMIKQIAWDDQWIGYDDNETIALKTAWADGECFGGTMVWSVDFYSGKGSNNPNVMKRPNFKPDPSGPWTKITKAQCDNDIFKDAPGPTPDYKVRWKAAETGSAWNDLIDGWRAYTGEDRGDKEKKLWTFYRFAFFFFGYPNPSQIDCAEPNANADCPEINCQNVPNPAGWLILQSLHAIWANFNTLETALSDADQEALNYMGPFQETFSPKPDESGISILYTMMAATNAFAFAAGGASFTLTEFQEIAVEGLNTLVETGMEFGKQYADEHKTDEAGIISGLNEQCGHIWDATKVAIEGTLRTIMEGDDDHALIMLLNLVDHGAMLGTNDRLHDDMRAKGLTMIYGGLLRATWQDKNSRGYPGAPYIFYVPASVLKCGDDPANGGLIQGDTQPLTNIITADHAKNSFCDSDGNSYYFLSGTQPQQFPGGDKDTLTGDGVWGDVSIEGITQSALNGFINNGFKNGFDINTDLSNNYLQQWTGGSLTGKGAFIPPGFFNFPVCFSVDSVNDNFVNWWGDPADPARDGVDVSENFPCQDGSHAESSGFIDAYKKKHGL